MDRVKKFLKLVSTTKFLVILIVVVQIMILIMLLNPVGFINQLATDQVVSRISSLTQIPQEEPIVVGNLGADDFPTAEQLKQHDMESMQIYKDAQDQDYLVIFSDKMIIFREAENRIIYEGATPNQLALKNQQSIVTNLSNKAKEQNIIKEDTAEIPYLRRVTTDLEKLKLANSKLYKNLKEGDIIAVFLEENKIIIYRPSDNSIVEFGNL